MVKYRNVLIGPIIDSNIEQFCKKNQQNIEILNIYQMCHEPTIQILTALSNITHLTLDTCPLSSGEVFDKRYFHPIELPKLVFLQSFSPLLNLIINHRVKEMVVIASIFESNKLTKSEAEGVRKFLSSCPDLISLKVEGKFDFFSGNYKFKLQKLHYANNEFSQYFPQNGYENFCSFLLSQKNSLKELTLDCFNLQLKGIILSDLLLTKYHDLSYSLKMLIEEGQEISPSKTLKELEIRCGGSEKSFGNFQTILKSCPMVEKLDLQQHHGNFHPLIPEISAALENLKELKVRIPFMTTTREPVEISIMQNLQNLHVHIELKPLSLSESMDLLFSLVRSCPKLKFFYIRNDMRWVFSKNEVTIDVKRLLLPLKWLEELQLKGFMLENASFINSTSIHTLKIFTKSPINHIRLKELFYSTSVRLSIINM